MLFRKFLKRIAIAQKLILSNDSTAADLKIPFGSQYIHGRDVWNFHEIALYFLTQRLLDNLAPVKYATYRTG